MKYEPVHEISSNVVYATSKASDQPEHMPSLIRAFASRLSEHHLKFLSLKEGCRGWRESTHVKMPHCWKSHATAHICMVPTEQYKLSNFLLRHLSSP